jgi:hypothetical protein
MKAFKQLPPLAALREVLSYDPFTGLWTWSQTKGGHVVKGKIAGSLNSNGYWCIKLNSHRYAAHRLAWLWIHNVDPLSLEIDHINGDRLDNRISNLRLVDPQQNIFNSKPYNKLKVKGVNRWGNRYRARITYNGISRYLGLFGTIEEAANAYDAEALLLFKEHARLNSP